MVSHVSSKVVACVHFTPSQEFLYLPSDGATSIKKRCRGLPRIEDVFASLST